MNCDTWVSKFMGLIYPWHRSGLCSHYLYPTNIGATQPELVVPAGTECPVVLLSSSWHLLSGGEMEKLYRLTDRAIKRVPDRGHWSLLCPSPSVGESDHHLPLLLLLLNGLTSPWNGAPRLMMISITIQMISSDKLQIILQWFPPPGQGHWLSMVHHSHNDKQDHQILAKTSDP